MFSAKNFKNVDIKNFEQCLIQLPDNEIKRKVLDEFLLSSNSIINYIFYIFKC